MCILGATYAKKNVLICKFHLEKYCYVKITKWNVKLLIADLRTKRVMCDLWTV